MSKAYNVAQIPFHKIDLKRISFYPELTRYYTGRFNENLKEICNIYDQGAYEDDLPDHLKLFLINHAIVDQAFKILGIKKIKSLRFREKEIREALEKERKIEALNPQIVSMLQKEISIGGIYSFDFLKALIVEIYESFEIEENVTASYIKRYYSVNQTTMHIEQSTTKTNGAYKILAYN